MADIMSEYSFESQLLAIPSLSRSQMVRKDTS